ncbi:MAG TPA: hypothetical protein VGL35_07615 [Rhizomicrobium sp.]|jgi:hypothetical protein
MNFWYLRLDFQAGDRPGDARARIRLADSGESVAPQVMGSSELDAQVDQMHAELEEIRKQGRASFADAKAGWFARKNSN